MDSPPMPLRFVKSVDRTFPSRKLVTTMTNQGSKIGGNRIRANKRVVRSQREGERFGKCQRRSERGNYEHTSALNHEIFDGAM
jgi:hypothetical protein